MITCALITDCRDSKSATRQSTNTMSCALRKASAALGDDILSWPAQEFVDRMSEVIEALSCAVPNKASRSVYQSKVAELHRYAIERAAVEVSRGCYELADFPSNGDSFSGKPYSRVRPLYKALIRAAIASGQSYGTISNDDLMRLLATAKVVIACSSESWTRFVPWWNRLSNSVGRQDLVISLPTRRPSEYCASRDELSDELRAQLESATRRLLGKSSVPIGHKPIAPSSEAFRTKIVMEHLGFIQKYQNVDLGQLVRLQDALTRPRIKAYLRFTSERSIALQGRGDMRHPGKTQKSILKNLEVYSRWGLGDPKLASVIRKIRRSFPAFVSRREDYKDHGTVDDTFQSCEAYLRAANDASLRFSQQQRALLVRDAVMLAILGMFAYRRSVVANLEIGSSFVRVHGLDGVPVWRVKLESHETKPRKRDLFHEFPPEFTYLFDFYVQVVRPILLRDGKHHFLLVGVCHKPLSKAAVSDRFAKSSSRTLGRERNPHSVRKALATDYLDADGDMATATAVLDASSRTIQGYYESRKTESAVKRLDKTLVPAWSKANGETP